MSKFFFLSEKVESEEVEEEEMLTKFFLRSGVRLSLKYRNKNPWWNRTKKTLPLRKGRWTKSQRKNLKFSP